MLPFCNHVLQGPLAEWISMLAQMQQDLSFMQHLSLLLLPISCAAGLLLGAVYERSSRGRQARQAMWDFDVRLGLGQHFVDFLVYEEALAALCLPLSVFYAGHHKLHMQRIQFDACSCMFASVQLCGVEAWYLPPLSWLQQCISDRVSHAAAVFLQSRMRSSSSGGTSRPCLTVGWYDRLGGYVPGPRQAILTLMRAGAEKGVVCKAVGVCTVWRRLVQVVTSCYTARVLMLQPTVKLEVAHQALHMLLMCT